MWEEFWGYKVWIIISKADFPPEKTCTPSKEHLTIDDTVQLHELISILDPLQCKVYTLPFWKAILGGLWSTITFTVKMKFFKILVEISWLTSLPPASNIYKSQLQGAPHVFWETTMHDDFYSSNYQMLRDRQPI